MRGYFGIGVESISKSRNAGALMRTGHAFGASFLFTVASALDMAAFRQSDTSQSAKSMPLYEFESVDALMLPRGCALVGVELIDEAVPLPSFRHPERAAYVFGPEAGSLSPELVARCRHVVQIPTAFCVNVSVAGAIVMYDRLISRGRHPDRPVSPGGPLEELAPHVQGGRKVRT
ncbi:MAG: RNA methyltransferase [Alphaproteobacteria bacterium]|nr:RNA methyltransferase [Alphaproteobacteria bacterium]